VSVRSLREEEDEDVARHGGADLSLERRRGTAVADPVGAEDCDLAREGGEERS
jgi:hypothetical protein